jgi:hypothetical protein
MCQINPSVPLLPIPSVDLTQNSPGCWSIVGLTIPSSSRVSQNADDAGGCPGKMTMRVGTMCGRFARIYFRGKLKEKYRLKKGELLVDRLEDRYNVAPQQPIGAVRTAEDGRELVLLRWGLIPMTQP